MDAFSAGFIAKCAEFGIPVEWMLKEADTPSGAFRELPKTFSPENGFHLNRKPGDEWSYVSQAAKTTDQATAEINNTGFGFHNPRLNDYGKTYAVNTGAGILDAAETAETKKEMEDNLSREELKETVPDFENFETDLNRRRAARMFDNQGPVPTIPQNFAQKAYDNLHRTSGVLNGRIKIPGVGIDKVRDAIFHRALGRIDRPVPVLGDDGNIVTRQYETLPKDVSDQDVRALSAIHYAAEEASPIYSDTDRFLKGSDVSSPYVDNKMSDILGVGVQHDVDQNGRAYYSRLDNAIHVPEDAQKGTVLHEYGHGLADAIGKAVPGYYKEDDSFEPSQLFMHPTILEEHGNADTLLGSGVMRNRTAGEWYYGNMLKNWYAMKLHRDAGTLPAGYSTFDKAAIDMDPSIDGTVFIVKNDPARSLKMSTMPGGSKNYHVISDDSSAKQVHNFVNSKIFKKNPEAWRRLISEIVYGEGPVVNDDDDDGLEEYDVFNGFNAKDVLLGRTKPFVSFH